MMLSFAFVLLVAVAVQGQDPLCGTEGKFCAENFTVQINVTQCGKYSEIFSEPNMTMTQNIPALNYSYTNTSEFTDKTVYLSEVLQSKAYELYSEQQALIDGAQSCSSSALKTEFTSQRLNSSQCKVDIDDVIASITPVLEDKWLLIHYGKSSDHPAKSCMDLFEHDPLLPSGMYWVSGSGGVPVQVYCDMEGTNCDESGGWMRLYKLDLESNDINFHTCPSSAFETSSVLGANKVFCRRSGNAGGCKSVVFSVNGQTYNKVCGKAKGYQGGTTDSFSRGGNTINLTPDNNYVDGISITHGSNPRTHVFTYVAGCSESGSCSPNSRCPCQTGANPVVPEFIGYHDYYCEAGSYWHPGGGKWYGEPLWDGKNCDYKETPCCKVAANLPWFMKLLPHSTSDTVEMRLCTNGGNSDENIGLSQFEIYIK